MLELIMQVSRGADDRLSGTMRLREGSELHHFSGTLELMRVFEDLIPFVPDPHESSASGARPAEPAASDLPQPKTS
jgi:hypothetical protein